MVRARKKENKTNQAREWDNKTKRAGQRNKEVGQRNKEAGQGGARESDNGTKNPYNETKKAGQESEAVEHPLTFGYYVNIQISNLRKERREGWNWNE